MKKGTLFVISGPSGVGKGTIVKEILDRREGGAVVSVSATTRPPRVGEIDGVSYYFTTVDDFRKRIDEDGFIEYAEVHENFYGTPKGPVEAQLAEGRDVILEIDVQGAMKVKKYSDDAVCIFILPPSMKILRARLEGRATDSQDVIEVRMANAMGEIEYLDRYDYGVVNDDLETAVQDVMNIMAAARFRVDSNVNSIIEHYREEL